MNRISVILASVVLLAGLLAGCGSTGSPGPEQPQTGNESGQAGSSSSQSSLDLRITEPPDNTVTNESTITVKGQTAPESVVNVNDQVTVADSDGNFSVEVTLDPGLNLIQVVASDESGADAIESITVTLAQ